MRPPVIAVLTLACTLCGCGTAQKVYAKYVVGRINVANGVPSAPGAPVIVQYSSDNFATVDGSVKVYNDQGLLTVPYHLDFAAGAGAYIQLRAFQDINGNGVWDPGEGSGRFDQTTTGNAAPANLSRIVGTTCSGSSSNSSNSSCIEASDSFSGVFVRILTLDLVTPDGDKTHFISGADIALDSTQGL